MSTPRYSTRFRTCVAGSVLATVPSGWRLELAGMRLDVYQVMFAAAGAAMLATLAMLRCLRNVPDGAEPSPQPAPADSD